MTDPPLILMVHRGRAWLVRGAWSRPVELDEFTAWAAYSGIALAPIPDCASRHVVLDTPAQTQLFDTMWLGE